MPVFCVLSGCTVKVVPFSHNPQALQFELWGLCSVGAHQDHSHSTVSLETMVSPFRLNSLSKCLLDSPPKYILTRKRERGGKQHHVVTWDTRFWTRNVRLESSTLYPPHLLQGCPHQILIFQFEPCLTEIPSFRTFISPLPRRIRSLDELFLQSWASENARDWGGISRAISPWPAEKMPGWEQGISFIFIPVSVGMLGDWQELREKRLLVSPCLPLIGPFSVCQKPYHLVKLIL